jgi:cyclic pyranopterin phosphate synthase
MSGKWKRHTNHDLWQQLDDLKTARNVFWEWVKAHAGHPLNEEADRLAVSAMRMRAQQIGETTQTRTDNDALPPKLTHIDSMGNAGMVDISGKSITERIAVATGSVHMNLATLDLVLQGGVSKGDVFTVARIAGISAAKRTWDFIPLAHQIQLSHVDIQFEPRREFGVIDVTAVVKTNAGTGVEMEALTAVTVSALTIYDMCKAIDRSITIGNVHLTKKSGGRTGEYESDSHLLSDKNMGS